MGRLDDLDLSVKLSGTEEAARLEAAQKRLLALRLVLGGQVGSLEIGPPILVLFEGWDASGKGGAIKRLVAGSTRAMSASRSSPPRATTRSAITGSGASGRPCRAGAA